MLVLDSVRMADSLSLPAKGLEGTIVSIHADYLNMAVAGEIVTLFKAGSASVPFGIEVAGVDDWRKLGLGENQPVVFGPSKIDIPSILAVEGLLDVERFASRITREHCHQKSVLVDRLGKLHSFCLASPRFGGILAFLGSYQPFAHWKYLPSEDGVFEKRLQASFEALLAGTATGDEFLIVEGVHGMLGLGPGLTPSGDDFLLGFLAGLAETTPESPNPSVAKLARCLAQDAPRRTTMMAATFLRYATKGQYHQYLVDLINLFRGGDETSMKAAAQKLLTLGHFSGTDLLLGFTFGGYATLQPCP